MTADGNQKDNIRFARNMIRLWTVVALTGNVPDELARHLKRTVGYIPREQKDAHIQIARWQKRIDFEERHAVIREVVGHERDAGRA